MSGDGQAARRPYSPSPRPTFDGPALISAQTVTRHIWRDETSGEVADWIFASTDLIHCLIFGLAPGGSFTHSPEYRTIFGADEVLTVLSGTLLLANPAEGEVLAAGLRGRELPLAVEGLDNRGDVRDQVDRLRTALLHLRELAPAPAEA